MEQNIIWNNENLIKILKEGGVAVMPTDTLYGIVGRAEDEGVVERIYKIRKRSPEKPCIILIGDITDLEKFSVYITDEQKKLLQEYWSSGAVSIILDCNDEKFSYLHRRTNTLAFRLPMQAGLRSLLKQTGPLIAPSANPEGLPPAQNIDEAKNYFGDSVDLYVDGGVLSGKASKIIKIQKDGIISVIRE